MAIGAILLQSEGSHAAGGRRADGAAHGRRSGLRFGMALLVQASVAWGGAAIGLTPVATAAVPGYDPHGPGQVVVGNCSGAPCLKRDGVGPYRPKGLILEGLAAAPSSFKMLTPAFRDMGERLQANPQKVLSDVKAFGADSVRFNIAQANLDPKSEHFDAKYVDQVVELVQRARAMKLVVLVEINDEQPPKLGRLGHPSDATDRVWQQLLPRFADDQGILIGAYNEPTMSGTNPAGLAEWQSSYNGAVAAIRATGAKNVVVVDGPYFGTQLPPDALSYLVNDPAHNLVYGVHPFPKGRIAYPEGWPATFEQFCSDARVQCQMTAWNIYSLTVNGFKVAACPAASPKEAQAGLPNVSKQLLQVAKKLNSGMYGWAFDYPNVIVDREGKAVGFRNFVDCDNTPGPWGAGELLKGEFADPRW